MFISIIAATAAIIVNSCNPTRNNASTRFYQGFLTKYNIHYNGEKHFDETLEDMENGYVDNYDQLLPVHPAEARGYKGELSMPTGDFTRSIEKAQKAIQLHSIKKTPRGPSRTAAEREWKTRVEYNPYLHNSWLLLGKSLYMQGDFKSAAQVFFYIAENFRWLPTTVAEARAWEALCDCALNNVYEAALTLENVKEKYLVSKESQKIYYLAYSSLSVHEKDYSRAAEYLQKAIALSKGRQKWRLRYLLAQVLVLDDRKEEAYRTFASIAKNITLDYRMRINARVHMSSVTPLSKRDNELKQLYKLAGYESNKQYLDRIYYAIGNLYVEQSDTLKAIDAYKKSIECNQANDSFQGEIELALGRLYYDLQQYVDARSPYARAVLLLPQTFPDYDDIKNRSDALDRYAVYEHNIQLQDSLLALADKGITQCEEFCRGLADEFIKRESKPQVVASEGKISSEKNRTKSPMAVMIATEPAIGETPRWYFYNPKTIETGKIQFQKLWGSRVLQDNWRLNNRGVLETDGSMNRLSENVNIVEEAAVQTDPLNDPASFEYYMKNIPFTPQEKENSHRIIIDAMFNQGIILLNDLHNASKAEDIFLKLLKLYPDNYLSQDIYHELFLIKARKGNWKEADEYRNVIAEKFPDTELGKAMTDTAYLYKLTYKHELIDSIYNRVFEAYLINDNVEVHRMVNEVIETYPDNELQPLFMFLDAMAYATDGDKSKFSANIEMLRTGSLSKNLQNIIAGINKNIDDENVFRGSHINLGSKQFSKSLLHDESYLQTNESQDTIQVFALDEDAPQIVAIIINKKDVNPRQLLYDVAVHNFSTYMAREFDLEINDGIYESVIIVSGFDNRRESTMYRNQLASSEYFELPASVEVVLISIPDYQIMLEKGLSWRKYINEMLTRRFYSGENVGFKDISR